MMAWLYRGLIILGLALALSACGLETYPAPSEAEKTTWRLCWDDLGRPVYASEVGAALGASLCEGQTPREIHWPERRALVKLDNLSPEHQELVRWAMWRWNVWAGREVFVETHRTWDVEFFESVLSPPTLLGLAPHRTEAGRLYGKVWINSMMPDDAYEDVAAHELGHMLGFAHERPGDPQTADSIMYPYHRAGNKRLTAADLRALRRLYGPR